MSTKTSNKLNTSSENHVAYLDSATRIPQGNRKKPVVAAKRMALYARVSTQEQTKGQYPSCDSQVEELEAYCRSRGWHIFDTIKDEGHRAGTLNRPGLAKLRWLVETEQIDGVICTWYNRLIGSRDFYVLDKEFQAHKVEFITIHDPADRKTASGRLLESMLVTIKTFENEQVAEKVRTKMRQRAEKGLWNGGLVPFGFVHDANTQTIVPDNEKAAIVDQMFSVYIEHSSDFAVRDWLKAHGIASPGGRAEWTPSSIRDLLMNRRYIAEIEINRDKKGIEGLSELESYRIVPAQHKPLVSKEKFDIAQRLRSEMAEKSPHRGGKGKGQSYSRNQCKRVYPLQGLMSCGVCGHAMSPHYVYHKPNPEKGRRSASYIYHYLCANQMKYRSACGHSNRILARVPESWIIERITDLVNFAGILEEALEMAWNQSQETLNPAKAALAECQRALQSNQQNIDELVESAKTAKGALLDLLSEKAHELKLERERLRAEKRKLDDQLAPLAYRYETQEIRDVLGDFPLLCEKATPEQLQALLRLIVRNVKWSPAGGHHTVQYYLPTLPKSGSTVMKPSLPETKRTNPTDVGLVRDFCMDWLPGPQQLRTTDFTSCTWLRRHPFTSDLNSCSRPPQSVGGHLNFIGAIGHF